MSIPFPANWIAKKPLQTKTIDTQISNCALWLPNSNCNSDSLYNMPNATPWSGWSGVTGLSLGNPSGYDFVGGQTVGYVNLTSTNVTSSTQTANLTLGTLNQISNNYNNCNCNTGYAAGVYNCYNNCNCNCACACDCACACACDCAK